MKLGRRLATRGKSPAPPCEECLTLRMEGYGPSTYGDAIADVYDDWYAGNMDPTAAVGFLASLSGKGRSLELGIGTGRVALPLAALGVPVSGIDASAAMVERLRAKPGGRDIPVSMGDFADIAVEGAYSLIYVAFATFFALGSQAEQIRCLKNVASHLEKDGSFVVEAFVPDMTRYRDNQSVAAREVALGRAFLEVARLDPVAQRIEASHLIITAEGARLYPVSLRYAWPAEFDAMALVASLGLASRYADYERRAFDATSTRHVSVYKPLGGNGR